MAMNSSSIPLRMSKERRYLEGDSSLQAGNSSSKQANGSVTIDDLPDEMLLEIFAYVDAIDNILQVCTRWKVLAQDEHLWHNKKYVVRKDTTDEEAIATFAAMPQLRTVILEKEVSAEVLEALSRSCPNLTTLETDPEQMLPMSATLFSGCKKIRKLAVSNWVPQTHHKFMDEVAQLTDLRVLHFLDCDYSCVGVPLRSLADGCPHLCELRMPGLMYDFEDAEYFISTHKHVLKRLSITWAANVGSCIVPLLPACAETLERLTLTDYDMVPQEEAAEAFTALGQLHNLRQLSFDFTERGVRHLVPALFENGRLSKLQRLSLFGVVADETMISVADHCPELQELTLGSCRRHTDALFEPLCRLKKLKKMKIVRCACLHEKAMSHIAKLPTLQTLNFDRIEFDGSKHRPDSILKMSGLRQLNFVKCNCEGIPFDKFPGRLVNLRELNIEDSKVDQSIVDEIRTQMPDLQVKFC